MFKFFCFFCFFMLAGCYPQVVDKPGFDTMRVYEDKHFNHNRLAFDKFLYGVKKILDSDYSTKKRPRAFISYSWYDVYTDEGAVKNRDLQMRLLELHADLESIGIHTFLDVKNLQGDIRSDLTENLNKSDFVFVVGTEKFKQRGSMDRLFLLPYFDKRLIPSSGNVVSLVHGPDFYAVYYMENGRLKEIITMPLSLAGIPWVDKAAGVKEARISKASNNILETIFEGLNTRVEKKVTNVAFEIGITMDKVQQNPKTLIPILFEGDHDSAFPSVIKNSLIRNFKNDFDYYSQMSTLSSYLGIIATICPSLIRSHEYISLVEKFEREYKK